MNAPDLQAIDLTPINRFEEFEPLYLNRPGFRGGSFT